MKTNKGLFISPKDKKKLIAGLKDCVKILGKMRSECSEMQKELAGLKVDLKNL